MIFDLPVAVTVRKKMRENMGDTWTANRYFTVLAFYCTCAINI